MIVYVVGKAYVGTWEVVGIFDTEEQAISKCVEENYFVGHVEINKDYGEERILWPGGYYPKERNE